MEIYYVFVAIAEMFLGYEIWVRTLMINSRKSVLAPYKLSIAASMNLKVLSLDFFNVQTIQFYTF